MNSKFQLTKCSFYCCLTKTRTWPISKFARSLRSPSKIWICTWYQW